jgi:signal transduction histidine kinase
MRGLGRRGRRAGWSLAAQLERHVDERTAELRQLAAEMEAAESRERSEIARELHDDLGQMLAAVNIRLALLGRHPEDVRQTADELSALVDRAQRCARSLAARLSPAVLNQLGLVPALEWLADEFRASHGLQVVVDDDGVRSPCPRRPAPSSTGRCRRCCSMWDSTPA